jgi:hypothetical protein
MRGRNSSVRGEIHMTEPSPPFVSYSVTMAMWRVFEFSSGVVTGEPLR